MRLQFSWLDYLICLVMIVVSLAIGIYFGYIKKPPPETEEMLHKRLKIENTGRLSNIRLLIGKPEFFGSDKVDEHLLGSRQMLLVPVAMSLVSTYISGVTILGTPAEIYYYGSKYWLVLLPISMMGPAVAFVYLPVYHALGVTTSYQYLTLRFHPYLDAFASVMFVVDEIIAVPITLYAPAISFNQVSGANVYLISFILCLSCTTYTFMGGIKGVVAADAFQTATMLLSVIFIVICGLIKQDGLLEVISKNKNSDQDRLVFFDFSPSLYERNTVWSMMFGSFFLWTSFNAINQTMVQRYMSLPNTKAAQYSVAIVVGTLLPFVSICCFIGWQLFAYYKECDPLTSGLIEAEDQIFTAYIMEALGNLNSVSGIYMAAVVGAALSRLSTSMNASAAIIYENILKRFFKMEFSEDDSLLLIRILVVVLSVLGFALVFVVGRVGSMFSSATALSSIAASTTFGIFTLGMLIPWSNTKGAFIGGIAGLILSLWIAVGTEIIIIEKLLPSSRLQVEVGGCEQNLTITTTPKQDVSDIFPLYKLSDSWICPIGVITVVTVGTIVSFITGPTDVKTMDRRLISPVLHRLLPVQSSS